MNSSLIVKKRDTTWDVAKAICIIFVVSGHTKCPEYYRDFIYLFHVGVFFYISGRYLNVNKNSLGGILRRFKSLIIPVWIWGMIFVILHNLLVPIGWEENHWNLTTICKNCLISLAFATPEKVFLGKWFFPCLFFGSVITVSLFRIKNKWILALVVFLLYVAGWYMSIGEYNRIVNMVSRIFVSVPILYMGYILRSWSHNIKFLHFLLGGIVLGISAFFIRIDMFPCNYSFFLALPLFTFFGVVFLIYLIHQIQKWIPFLYNILAKIGTHTMDILILHIIGFKCFFLVLSMLDVTVSYDDSIKSIWFVFTLVGVLVPILYVKAGILIKSRL